MLIQSKIIQIHEQIDFAYINTVYLPIKFSLYYD